MDGPARSGLRGAGLPIALGSALAAGVLASASPPVGTGALACLFPVAGAALLLSRRGSRALATLLVVLAAGLAGLARGALPPAAPAPCAAALRGAGLPGPDARAAAALQAVARVREAVVRGDRATLDVDVVRAAAARAEGTSSRQGLAAEGPAPHRALTMGEHGPVALRARVTTALPAPLPGDGLVLQLRLDEIPPDQAGRLRREGIACAGRALRLAVIDPAWSPVASLRRRIAGNVSSALGRGPDAALVLALSTGDRSLVGADQSARFADSGLAHLVSISGLHVSLLVLGLYRLLAALLARLTRTDAPRAAALATLPLVPAYALLAGAAPPVVRASIAAALVLLATLVLRTPHAATSLAIAAALVIALDPAALFDPSFQLSFAACAGLLVLAPGLRALVPLERATPASSRPRRIAEWLLAAVVTTAAATLATLPLTALHFQRTSLAAIPANVVAVPLGLAATVASVVAGAAAALGPDAAALAGLPALLACGLLDSLAAFFASLPGARIALPPPSGAEVAALLVAALALASLRHAPRRAAAALLAALAVMGAPRALRASGDGLLHVDFLPVGQGDATLLRLPAGGAVLVDTGGDLHGRARSAPVVREVLALGVTSLDALVITHLHPDHAADAPEVLRSLSVRELWTSGRPLDGPLGQALHAAAAREGTALRTFSAGAPPVSLHGVTFEVLGPPDRDGLGHDPLLGENDGSLVLRVVFRDVAVLLPGDVEAAGESELVTSGRDLSAVLLKVPHHGSRTSSSAQLLEAVLPAFAVFSVGRHNLFGFPHAEVEERYRAMGVELDRTDLGRVSFTSDGTVLRREGSAAAAADASW